jgi:hypothetical protein
VLRRVKIASGSPSSHLRLMPESRLTHPDPTGQEAAQSFPGRLEPSARPFPWIQKFICTHPSTHPQFACSSPPESFFVFFILGGVLGRYTGHAYKDSPPGPDVIEVAATPDSRLLDRERVRHLSISILRLPYYCVDTRRHYRHYSKGTLSTFSTHPNPD